MAHFAPQYELFKIMDNLSKLGRYTFWGVLILSIIPFIFNDFCVKNNLINIVNISNIIGISLFFGTELINELVIIPRADNKRRDDFIDNSFGSKFSINSSNGYYDNDEINKGLYKAAVNLFENCFFTYSLVKITIFHKSIVAIIMIVIIIVLAFYGFKEVSFILNILQAFFSVNILGLFLKNLALFKELTSIQDNWILLFQQTDIKTNTLKYQANIYKYWLEYETLHSRINARISNKIFTKHNTILTENWKQLKQKYNIL